MSIFEYNEERGKRKLRKAEYEAGKMMNKRLGEKEGKKATKFSFLKGNSIEKGSELFAKSEKKTIRMGEWKMDIKSAE